MSSTFFFIDAFPKPTVTFNLALCTNHGNAYNWSVIKLGQYQSGTIQTGTIDR